MFNSNFGQQFCSEFCVKLQEVLRLLNALLNVNVLLLFNDLATSRCDGIDCFFEDLVDGLVLCSDSLDLCSQLHVLSLKQVESLDQVVAFLYFVLRLRVNHQHKIVLRQLPAILRILRVRNTFFGFLLWNLNEFLWLLLVLHLLSVGL